MDIRPIEQMVAKDIRLFRKRAGLTQRQLAERVGVVAGTIQQYELGKRMPSIKRMERISAVLGMEPAPALSLNTLRDEIYQDAVAHGLWEGAELAVAVECAQRGSEWKEDLLRSACAQKIWDEAVELDEAWKSREHYSEELADVVIMCMSVAGKLGIDIDAAIRRKMEINKKRPWKHGRE